MHAWMDGEMTAKTSSYSFCDDDERETGKKQEKKVLKESLISGEMMDRAKVPYHDFLHDRGG